MEILSVVITLAIVALIVLWYSRKFKNAFLDTLEFLPGEKILHEESVQKLEANVRLKQIRTFPNSLVRITNKRLILAQNVPGSDKKSLRYVFNLNSSAEKIEPYLGYTTMSLTKKNLNVTKSEIEIIPTMGTGSQVPNWIKFTPTNFNACTKALGL